MARPKGTIDYFGVDGERLLEYQGICRDVFERNGGQYLETPVFENRETLLNKYGDDAESKLIYNLEDDRLALRYDLTVPFMRFLKTSGIKVVRRYSIGKVYRRDQPSVKQGRYREFYQADFDIVGELSCGGASELLVLNMVKEILTNMSIKEFTIYVNFTDNLYRIIVELAGVEKEKFKSICSTIDKLDKQLWDELVPELISKGLSSDQIEKIAMSLEEISTPPAWAVLLDVYGLKEYVRWSNILARGLDYYNGMIFEVKIGQSPSICGGGQYRTESGEGIGFSVGLTRIINLVTERVPHDKWKMEYFITTVGNIDPMERLRAIVLCYRMLSNKVKMHGDTVKITWSLSKDKKLGKVLAEKAKEQVRWVVVIAETEWALGKVIIKDLYLKSQTELEIQKQK